MARKKDSILPAESPRAGAVWSKTDPMALHDGYARWNIAVASAAARKRSNVRCEDLHIRFHQSWEEKLDWSCITYAGIVAEIRRISVQALMGTREKGLRVMRSCLEDGSTAP